MKTCPCGSRIPNNAKRCKPCSSEFEENRLRIARHKPRPRRNIYDRIVNALTATTICTTKELCAVGGNNCDTKHAIQHLIISGEIERVKFGHYRLAPPQEPRRMRLPTLTETEPFIRPPSKAQLMGGRA